MLCELSQREEISPPAGCLNPCYSGICSVSLLLLELSKKMKNCLNPCYSGICSVSTILDELDEEGQSLNPCYSGICSVSTERNEWFNEMMAVLILVIVEYAL